MAWQQDLFDVLIRQGIGIVAHVPDAGHSQLIKQCDQAESIRTVTLTSEQDGVGVLSGAWAGGIKGVLLMQSSGVGNTVNALSLAAIWRIPFLMLISMRGEWGEFIPWQVPMGQATPSVLASMNVMVHRVDKADDVAPTASSACEMTFSTRQATAVLLSQKLLGAKKFNASK